MRRIFVLTVTIIVCLNVQGDGFLEFLVEVIDLTVIMTRCWCINLYDGGIATDPVLRFMHRHLVMMTVRSITSTRNSRKP